MAKLAYDFWEWPPLRYRGINRDTQNRFFVEKITVEESSLKGTWFVKPRFRVKMRFTKGDKISLKGTNSFSKGEEH